MACTRVHVRVCVISVTRVEGGHTPKPAEKNSFPSGKFDEGATTSVILYLGECTWVVGVV